MTDRGATGYRHNKKKKPLRRQQINVRLQKKKKKLI